MTTVTDKDRAAVYRELAGLDVSCSTGIALFSRGWLKSEADRLDPSDPRDEWLASLDLSLCRTPSDPFADALYCIRWALVADDTKNMLEYSQIAAAHIVNWRRRLPAVDRYDGCWSDDDRSVLREVVRKLLDADSSQHPERLLRVAESGLFHLWKRHRQC